MADASPETTAGDIDRRYQTDVGLELRIGFSETNLIHSELSRTGHSPLILRADDLRQVLLEQGWLELIVPPTKQ